MKPVKIINSYVYIVLEHHTQKADAKIHGVYINKEEAEGKFVKLTKRNMGGYLAVLKKPVLGKPAISTIKYSLIVSK